MHRLHGHDGGRWTWRRLAGHNAQRMVATTEALINERELRRYVARIEDRWSLEGALLSGARVEDARGAGAQRQRGEEYVVVLVSPGFDGMPWLERVYQAASLWDAAEMGAPADVHCYTPAEFARKRDALAVVRTAAERGLDLRAPLDEQLRAVPASVPPLGEDDAITAI